MSASISNAAGAASDNCYFVRLVGDFRKGELVLGKGKGMTLKVSVLNYLLWSEAIGEHESKVKSSE